MPRGILSDEQKQAPSRAVTLSDPPGEEDIAQRSDRCVDALVAWGKPDTVAERVSEHLTAGADHVAVTVLNTTGSGGLPRPQWRQLANVLID